MTPIIKTRPQTVSFLRPLAGAALLSVALLASASVFAADPAAAMPQKARHAPKNETVEDRISDLHKSLKITADEEANWTAVAQAMRDNDAALKTLVAARASGQKLSAVDDLKMYEKFAQAHVDGLKNLVGAFETLYAAMPDQQKVVADGVFQAVGQKGNH